MMKGIRKNSKTKNIPGIIRVPKHTFFLGLGLIFCVFIFMLGGCKCWDQPGETLAEGRRRHIRRGRINKLEMAQDIDRMFLLDEPSKLTDKKVP